MRPKRGRLIIGADGSGAHSREPRKRRAAVLLHTLAERDGGGGNPNDDVYRASGASVAPLWRVADDRHTGGRRAAPRACGRRVVGVVDRVLLTRPERK